jgi:hypothetical protein
MIRATCNRDNFEYEDYKVMMAELSQVGICDRSLPHFATHFACFSTLAHMPPLSQPAQAPFVLRLFFCLPRPAVDRLP